MASRRWVSAIAAALALAGFAYTWFGPSGELCSGRGDRTVQCVSTTFASGMHPGILAAALLGSALFSILPVWLHRSSGVLLAWGALTFAFYLISFGVGLWLLPAGVAAIIAGTLGGGRPTRAGSL